MNKISIVCGSFHKEEMEKMLEFAHDQADKEDLIVSEVVWVPGAMEVPLAISRLIADDIVGVARAMDDPTFVAVSGKGKFKTLEDLVAASKKAPLNLST